MGTTSEKDLELRFLAVQLKIVIHYTQPPITPRLLLNSYLSFLQITCLGCRNDSVWMVLPHSGFINTAKVRLIPATPDRNRQIKERNRQKLTNVALEMKEHLFDYSVSERALKCR